MAMWPGRGFTSVPRVEEGSNNCQNIWRSSQEKGIDIVIFQRSYYSSRLILAARFEIVMVAYGKKFVTVPDATNPKSRTIKM